MMSNEKTLRTRLREKAGFFRSPEGRKALQASKDAGAPTDEVRRAMAEVLLARSEHRPLADDLKQKGRKKNEGSGQTSA